MADRSDENAFVAIEVAARAVGDLEYRINEIVGRFTGLPTSGEFAGGAQPCRAGAIGRVLDSADSIRERVKRAGTSLDALESCLPVEQANAWGGDRVVGASSVGMVGGSHGAGLGSRF